MADLSDRNRPNCPRCGMPMRLCNVAYNKNGQLILSYICLAHVPDSVRRDVIVCEESGDSND